MKQKPKQIIRLPQSKKKKKAYNQSIWQVASGLCVGGGGAQGDGSAWYDGSSPQNMGA